MEISKIWGYDFEVFSKIKPNGWWCCTFINKDDRNEIVTIVNDRQKFVDFYNANSDAVFVGYNSKFYDSVIFKGILNNMNPAWLNDQLIEKGKKEYQLLKGVTKFKLNNYDVMLKDKSLKQLEGFMGDKIKESDVPFDKDTPLTEDEIVEVIDYNIHDVQETLNVLDNTMKSFGAVVEVINMFDLDSTMLNNTEASLACDVLGSVQQHTLDDEFDITIPERLSIQDKYKYIVDWYLDDFNKSYKLPLCTEKASGGARQLLTKVGGCDCVFGYGGLHGSKDNEIFKGILVIMDVASLYPSLMINENYSSRKLKDPNKFKEMRDRRLELKKAKDERQSALKLIINATYGILKSRDKACYDPVQSNNVCIAGQLYLTELAGDLEDVCEILQLNTDGIYVRCASMEDVDVVKKIASDWEKRTNLELEIDVFEKGELIQKDVNNYLLIDRSDNHFKRKGAYVKKLSKIDNDLPIINKALVDYFVHGTSVEETVNKADKLIDFQQIIKLTALYKNVVYGEVTKVRLPNGKEKLIVENGIPLKEKVHRVFASTRSGDKGIYKTKVTGGEISYEKVMNTPEKCFIDNDNINGKSVPEYLDRQYYIDMALDRIKQFTTKEIEKIDDTPNKLFECMQKSNTFYDFLVNCKEYKIGDKVLEGYLTANCCSTYGKTKKLLDFKEWFDVLYGKNKLTVTTFNKKITNDTLKELILSNSELSTTGKTYNNLDSKKVLLEFFDTLEDINIHPYEIISSQISKFGKPFYTDDRADNETWMVLNWRDVISPNVILYNIFNGSIKYLKVKKECFKILPLIDGDIIRVTGKEKAYGEKIIGKDEKGVNIIAADVTKEFDVITKYEILFRNYQKK